MTTAIRASVRSLDSTLPVFAIRTMDEGLDRIMAQARFNTMLMTLLAATGLVLAALGIYSVIAWLVAQRTREIGVRMALGASKRDVIRMMSVHGLKPVIAGPGGWCRRRVGDDAVAAEPVVRSRPARSAHVAGDGNGAADRRRRGGGDSGVARHRDRSVGGVTGCQHGTRGRFPLRVPALRRMLLQPRARLRQRAVGRDRSRGDADQEIREVTRIAERDAFASGLHHFPEDLRVVVGGDRHAGASQIGELHRQIEAG